MGAFSPSASKPRRLADDEDEDDDDAKGAVRFSSSSTFVAKRLEAACSRLTMKDWRATSFVSGFER
jgi:hypothetical protein